MSNLKSAMYFELPIATTGWTIRYTYIAEGRLSVGLHWGNKPIPSHSGECRICDLAKIADTFQAIDYKPPQPILTGEIIQP